MRRGSSHGTRVIREMPGQAITARTISRSRRPGSRRARTMATGNTRSCPNVRTWPSGWFYRRQSGTARASPSPASPPVWLRARCSPAADAPLSRIARLVTGPDHRWILPHSVVLAPVLLLGADVVGRVLVRPDELAVGIVTAFRRKVWMVSARARCKCSALCCPSGRCISITNRVARSTRVPIADRCPRPTMRSPSQWPGDGPIGHLGRTFADQDHGSGEARLPPVGLAARLAPGPPSALGPGQLPAKLTAARHVKGLVDGLVGRAHPLVVGEVSAELVGDLLLGSNVAPDAAGRTRADVDYGCACPAWGAAGVHRRGPGQRAGGRRRSPGSGCGEQGDRGAPGQAMPPRHPASEEDQRQAEQRRRPAGQADGSRAQQRLDLIPPRPLGLGDRAHRPGRPDRGPPGRPARRPAAWATGEGEPFPAPFLPPHAREDPRRSPFPRNRG